MPDTSLLHHNAAIARAERAGDKAAADRERAALAVAKIQRFVTKTIEAAPPLTPAQRQELARLLNAGGAKP